MGYIAETLSAGEEVRTRFRLHWASHIWLWITVIASVGSMGILSPLTLLEWLRLRGIEMGVTTRRVIHKRGIFGRNTQEMRLEAIEACEVQQTGWGRVFGRGTVTVYGRGTSDVIFKGVRNPMAVKRAIEAGASLV